MTSTYFVPAFLAFYRLSGTIGQTYRLSISNTA